MTNIARYVALLQRIRDYLVTFGDEYWAPLLNEWLAELGDDVSDAYLREHASRSMKATSGMGSLGDLSISPGNGHKISNDREEISRASNRLWDMTEELYVAAKAIVNDIGS